MCDHHGHGEGGCSHEATGVVHAEEGTTYDMSRFIDLDQLVTLNETIENSGRGVFRSWMARIDPNKFVESDTDEELLFRIPFTGTVKITGMVVISDGDETSPAKVRLYKNKESMTFDDCSIAPEQEINLKQDTTGVVDYPLKASKFNSLHHLTIHVSDNFGGENTKINYIGFRGEFQEEFRERVVIATYEARALTKDHKGEIPDAVMRDLM
ncbi:unnamed protein product, partial [Mesorhabditis belari]|uniref:PITH domain-containing protein n=1 Tax=Mesorhabditis belari TaxID=2138241 RepID=A0AAF3E9I1_9BILA